MSLTDSKVAEILELVGGYWRNGYVQSPKRPQITPEKAAQAIQALITEAVIAELEAIRDHPTHVHARAVIAINNRIQELKKGQAL